MRGDCQERETTKAFIYIYRSIVWLIYLLIIFYERTAPYWTVRSELRAVQYYMIRVMQMLCKLEKPGTEIGINSPHNTHIP